MAAAAGDCPVVLGLVYPVVVSRCVELILAGLLLLPASVLEKLITMVFPLLRSI